MPGQIPFDFGGRDLSQQGAMGLEWGLRGGQKGPATIWAEYGARLQVMSQSYSSRRVQNQCQPRRG